MARRRRTRRPTYGRDQRTELEVGPDLATRLATGGRRGLASQFDSEDARREAWYEHREALLAGCHPGRRPWGFWAIEVERPELSRADELEQMRVLVADDHLEAQEVEVLLARGAEAQRRVGTDAEQRGPGPDSWGPDKRDAAIARMIRAGANR